MIFIPLFGTVEFETSYARDVNEIEGVTVAHYTMHIL